MGGNGRKGLLPNRSSGSSERRQQKNGLLLLAVFLVFVVIVLFPDALLQRKTSLEFFIFSTTDPLLAELYAGQPIKAYPCFCRLDRKLSMYIGEDADHKLTTEMFCSDRLRQWFVVVRHVHERVKYHRTDSL